MATDGFAKGDAQAVIDTVERLSEHATEVLHTDEGREAPVAVVPIGKQLLSLKKFTDEYRTKPERRSGQASLTTERSFIDHVQRFSGQDSVVFVDDNEETPSLTAVYDYNPAGHDPKFAAFGKHRARYDFPISKEWAAWQEKDDEPMNMAEFSIFLEDRIADVISADANDEKLKPVVDALGGGTFAAPSQLVSLARSFQINASVAIRQAITLQSGELDVQFVETHTDGDGKPIKVPNLFAIGIPVFQSGTKYKIVCRLRYRKDGQMVRWFYNIFRSEVYFDAAVSDSAENVGRETGRLVLFGKPEA